MPKKKSIEGVRSQILELKEEIDSDPDILIEIANLGEEYQRKYATLTDTDLRVVITI